jgi:hypothetical protein
MAGSQATMAPRLTQAAAAVLTAVALVTGALLGAAAARAAEVGRPPAAFGRPDGDAVGVLGRARGSDVRAWRAA